MCIRDSFKGDKEFFMSLLQELHSGRFINWLISKVTVSPDLFLLDNIILDRVDFAKLDYCSALTGPSATKAHDNDSISKSR